MMALGNPLLTFEKGSVTRFVCSVRARDEPVARLRRLEKHFADLYQGKWSLVARPAEVDDWQRPLPANVHTFRL